MILMTITMHSKFRRLYVSIEPDNFYAYFKDGRVSGVANVHGIQKMKIGGYSLNRIAVKKDGWLFEVQPKQALDLPDINWGRL